MRKFKENEKKNILANKMCKKIISAYDEKKDSLGLKPKNVNKSLVK